MVELDWKAIAIYLADCHAANLELALHKKIPKSERRRLILIMETSQALLAGTQQPRGSFSLNPGMLVSVIDRLSHAITIIKQHFPEVKS